jgi:hypothetical protein
MPRFEMPGVMMFVKAPLGALPQQLAQQRRKGSSHNFRLKIFGKQRLGFRFSWVVNGAEGARITAEGCGEYPS